MGPRWYAEILIGPLTRQLGVCGTDHSIEALHNCSRPRALRNRRSSVISLGPFQRAEAFSFSHLLAQSISRSRRTAGACGFFILSHWSVRPARYGEPSRLLATPSQPSMQACW